MTEDRDAWGFFLAMFFYTCFMVICNYGPAINIFLWIVYMMGKPMKTDWDKLHRGIIVVCIIINIILTCMFMKFWL